MSSVNDLTENGRTVLNVCISMTVIATVAVILRIVAKLKSNAKWKASDYFIIISFVTYISYVAVLLRGVYTSGGTLNQDEMSSSELVNAFFHVYITESLFTATITFVKFSIITFALAIFTTEGFRLAMKIIGGLCLLWFFVCFFVSIFQCTPIRGAWEVPLVVSGQARCIVYGHFLVGYELSNMLLDIAIIGCCIWVIRGLQLSLFRKIIVGAIFVIAGFICVACIIRISYLNNAQLSNPVGLSNGLNWSTVELAIAILCACFPCWGPILPTEWAVRHLEDWYSRTAGSKTASGGRHHFGSGANYREYNNINPAFTDQRPFAHAHAADTSSQTGYHMQGINVRHSIEVA